MSEILGIDPGAVSGLAYEARVQLTALLETYEKHRSANAIKARYYEGKVPLSEVNLGIALPKGMGKLEIGCSWGAKCVDVLAARSMFDGYVGESGEDIPALDALVSGNQMVSEYAKAVRDELKFGTTFATLSADPELGCRVRWHSPRTAAARWDGELGRISCGFAVIDVAPDNRHPEETRPSLVNLYTDDAIWVLHREGSQWYATWYTQQLGRPMMEPMIWSFR